MGNDIEDIEKLVTFAHVYNTKVYVAVNTVLFDSELDDVKHLIYLLYDIGVDALIIQDTGILEMNLPPIKIHASTQMHNISPEKILFWEKCGLKRVILPREMSINNIMNVRKVTNIELESFVHGALCVCYSGQCYLSLAINGKSGNRGECTQPCRSMYDLVNNDGDILIHNKYLLSLRDFNASQYLRLLVNAGVTSLKIEGRLKNLSYVKNVTAYYRQLIDKMGDDVSKSSSGKCTYSFTPDVECTFNRNYTSYFLEGHRTQMASFNTQKSIGKKIGKVITSYKDAMRVDVTEPLHSGDGICFFNKNEELSGFFVNRFNNNIITPNKTVDIVKGTTLYRNNDYEFEKLLQNEKSAERKIDVNMVFDETEDGFMLTITDKEGCIGTAKIVAKHENAINVEKSLQQIQEQLSKMGQTPYSVESNIDNKCDTAYFIPASVLNELRRLATEDLTHNRLLKYKAIEYPAIKNDEPYIESEVDYRANITNKLSADFYRRHKVEDYEPGLDLTRDFKGKALMTTRYCLRYELGQCLKTANRDSQYEGQLFLESNGHRFELVFDCEKCEMKVVKHN